MESSLPSLAMRIIQDILNQIIQCQFFSLMVIVTSATHGSSLLLKRDSAKTIRFASLQSVAGRRLLEEHKIDENYIESLVFFEEGSFSVSSNAALRTLSYLDGWQKHLIFLSVVPRSLRDLVYRFIAKNRYKWFGRREQCMVPTAELSKRFLPD